MNKKLLSVSIISAFSRSLCNRLRQHKKTASVVSVAEIKAAPAISEIDRKLPLSSDRLIEADGDT
ncbi:hypothetical protein O9993_18820 [Vibrio lentus]|nr:hypothetical protein [Vibrio lentus]